MRLTLFLGLLHMVSEPARKPHVGLETLPHNVSPNKDVRNLSGGDCIALIWVIVWYVWACDESHNRYLLGWIALY